MSFEVKDEVHLLIVWANACNKFNSIIDDIANNFVIKDVLRITWSENKFSENLTRFYGVNLPSGCDKETHIGKGDFYAIVFLDANPKYAIRETSKGKFRVNINIFDAKQKYRDWTGGGHKIHATNSSLESLHDIFLLLGLTPNDFAQQKKWNRTIKPISQDLIGSDGWRDIQELFTTMNHLCRYVVMRNFEPLPNNYHLAEHGDIDLLVDDLVNVVNISNAKKVFLEENRVHYFVKIAGDNVPFDFRYVGDSYYDTTWQVNSLTNRELVRECFYAPKEIDYFYSLLYHALIHKTVFSQDYANRLIKLGARVGVNFDGTPSYGAHLLSAYLYKNDYEYVCPIDQTVYYNKYWVAAYKSPSPPNVKIAEIIESSDDISLLSEKIFRQCNDWQSIYHLSRLRANILRPFESIIKGSNILEIGAGCGTITRYLGECGANVFALECSLRSADIARSRTKNLNNVTVTTDNLDNFKCDLQFDLITIIGVIKYANLFTLKDKPALSMLKYAVSLLKPNGKLIIAVDNKLGLKYFAGAMENCNRQPMYGIEGRFLDNQPQSFGKIELLKLLEEAGLVKSELLAPFPDHDFPVSIITEQGAINNCFDGATLAGQSIRSPQQQSTNTFSCALAWKGIFNNHLTMDMTNSLLVIASNKKQPLVNPNILAYHYSTTRLPHFCKETKFILNDAGDITVNCSMLQPLQINPIISKGISLSAPNSSPYFLGKPFISEFIDTINSTGWTVEDIYPFASKYIGAIKNVVKAHGGNINTETIFNFDPKAYLESNASLKHEIGEDKYHIAFNHWLDHGIKENIQYDGILKFDPVFYLNKYPDLKFKNAFGENNYREAFNHWLGRGIYENRDSFDNQEKSSISHNIFDLKSYLDSNNNLQTKHSKNNYRAAFNHWLDNIATRNKIILPGKFLDLVPQNMIIKPDGEIVAFDLEWITSKPLTLGFLFFRGLFVSLGGIVECALPADNVFNTWKHVIQKAALSCGIIISDKTYKDYLEKEIDFLQRVTGFKADLIINNTLPIISR